MLVSGILIFIFAAPTVSIETEFLDLATALKENAIDQALSAEKKISDPVVRDLAFLEIQKSLYKNRRWPEFFGRSVYYRSLYSSTRYTLPILVIEVLALSRHCQSEAARALAEAGQAIYRPLLEPLLRPERVTDRRLRHALRWLELATGEASHARLSEEITTHLAFLSTLSELSGSAPKMNSLSPAKPDRSPTLWPLRSHQLSESISPDRVRVHVEDRCQ